METSNLQTTLLRFNLNRQRFEYRLHFFARCLRDIEADFHKQYGPFYQDWELTQEACQQYITATEDYLRTRDIIAMEGKLLLGNIAEAQTTYAIKTAKKRFTELMDACTHNDCLTLSEIDEDINNVRTIYRMIAVAEYDQED